jgi:hypothetical protein
MRQLKNSNDKELEEIKCKKVKKMFRELKKKEVKKHDYENRGSCGRRKWLECSVISTLW